MKKILLLASLLVLLSCQKDFVEQGNIYKNADLVSLADAQAIATVLDGKQIGFVSNKTTSDVNKKIRYYKILGNTEDPSMYLFNYESGGYVIISADKKQVPILAFSESGEMNVNDLNAGLHLWFVKNHEDIVDIKRGRIKPNSMASSEWSRYLKLASISSKNARDDDPIDPNPLGCYDNPTTVVGPLTATSWGQGCGYNSFMGTCSIYGYM